MLTGSPISSVKTSPPRARAPACSTSWTASSTLMKYRVISGSVTVTGPPAAIWLRNVGTTDPRLPSTLPNRTAHRIVP